MKSIGKKLCCLIFFLLIYQVLFAQTYEKLNAFTTDHGLPSNHIYDLLEDNNGFLWIATDNGVSRFDGKYFQNFSVKDGLPSSEALQLIKEKDGTIWINCYKQLPSYFDERTNKFTVVKSKKLNEISKALLRTAISCDGHLLFFNNLGTVSLKNKKPLANSAPPFSMTIDGKRTSLTFKHVRKNKTDFIRILFTYESKNQDSIFIKSTAESLSYSLDNNKLYVFNDSRFIYKISIKKLDPLSYHIDSVIVPEKNSFQKLSNQTLISIGKTGLISIFDKATFKLKYSFQAGPSANCTYTDGSNRLWVGTLDKGLLLYNKNSIKRIQTSEQIINNNFLSVAVKNDVVVAGNYYGQVLQVKDKHVMRFDITSVGRTTWLRKLIYIPKGILAVHDLGYSLNFRMSNAVTSKHGNAYIKNAINLNDSLVILSTNVGIIKLNTSSFLTTNLSEKTGIAPALVKGNDSTLYFAGSAGLEKYHLKTNTFNTVKLPKKWLNEKINILASSDDFLFICTRSDKILILKDGHEVASITDTEDLPENINNIFSYKNRIWLGSKTGIHVMNYSYKNKKFNFSIKNISKTDGLPSNTINDFSAENDTIYAATENGIAIIPADYQSQRHDIKLQLTEVKINQIFAPLANSYNLKSDQNNITLQFAGIELGGHFKNLQYAINHKAKYNNLVGNTLNVQLAPGENTIYVRAVDVNGELNKATIKLHFFIETPFYKTGWFWILITITLTVTLLWLYNRGRLAKQKIAFQQQLALVEQREKIVADLHDDIGSSLSSLQLNSAIANQLISKDMTKAQHILDKIENQSKNLADKIGDIIWSMKPGEDEFMTLSSRIKTFANDILGSTAINYKIEVDEKLNGLIQDIPLRKNLVFIAKEAINNCAKYSQASQLSFSLKRIENKLELDITDNGIGFDINQQRGNGLTNMRKRTQDLNGTFDLSSSKNGTKILVIIPLVP
jgi:signal transduction histidine kinase/ligand-binding sensor domain-containing protein